MWWSALRCVPLIAGLGIAASAEQPAPERPACTAATVGRFWPEEANDNPKFVAALMPYGLPEICNYHKKSYRWRSYSVSVEQLRKDVAEKKLKVSGQKIAANERE